MIHALLLAAAAWVQPAAGDGPDLALEPLVPGRELALDAGEHELRYRALWDVALALELAGEGAATARVTLVAPSGETLAAGDAGGPALAAELAEGADACLRVTLDAPAVLRAREDPPFEAWSARVPEPALAREPGPELAAALADAQALFDEARPLAASDPARARELGREAIALVEGADGALEHVASAEMLNRLANLALHVQDLAASAHAYELAYELDERGRAPGDVGLQRERVNVGTTLRDLGRAAEAAPIVERAALVLERLLPEGDLTVAWARMNAAVTRAQVDGWAERIPALRKALRDVDAAAAAVPAADERAAWAAGVARAARNNLARASREAGDLREAMRLFEDVLRRVEADAAASPFDLLRARINYGASLTSAGDRVAAAGYLEAALASAERLLPPGHTYLSALRSDLAVALEKRDLPARAKLERRVVEDLERTRAPADADLVAARCNLAITLTWLERHEEALEQVEAALAAQEEAGAGALALSWTRAYLADVLAASGRDEEALALLRPALALLEELLAEGDRRLLSMQDMRAKLALRLGAPDAGVALARVADGVEARLRGTPLLAPRELAALVGSLDGELDLLLSCGGPALHERAFELAETCRALVSWRLAGEEARSDPELRALAARAEEARVRLHDLVAGWWSGAAVDAAGRERLRDARADRDRAEGELRRVLASRGAAPPAVARAALAASLPPDAAAVALRVYDHLEPGGSGEPAFRRERRLLAHVVRPGGRLERVELGPLEPALEEAEAWRAALGQPVGAARALDVVPLGSRPRVDAGALAARGAALRARVLDPVLARLDGARRVALCLDGALALVPWDALPLEDGGRVGDRVALVLRPSLAPPPARTSSGGAGLLAVGGVDYGAPRSAGAEPVPASAPRSAAAPAPRYGRLAATRAEVEELAALFRDERGAALELLEGAGATKAALRRALPGKRFVHVATHGVYAGEELSSVLGAGAPGSGSWSAPLEDEVTGFAPYALCGLALAGANSGPTSTGELPGVLTGEELCALDLSACELAVLSACETGVGNAERAGQNVLSLQAALHVAGARATIASLWKVDDEATRVLMRELYTGLWVDGLDPAEALWRAKAARREAGAPERDWAGWVLSSTPAR